MICKMKDCIYHDSERCTCTVWGTDEVEVDISCYNKPYVSCPYEKISLEDEK